MNSKSKFMLGVAFSVLSLFSVSTVDAYQTSLNTVISISQKAAGDWFDANGNKVLTISNGYINGCPIVGGTDFVGGYPGAGVFIIQEAQGRKAIHLEWMGVGNHKTLIMNKTTQLNNGSQQHYESVHGVYLGMTKDAVYNLLGKPSSVSKSYGREILKYNKLGFYVVADNNIVTVIRLTGSNTRLEKSGLTKDSSVIDYYNFYQFNRVPSEFSKDKFQGCFSIGHGEYIAFDNGEVSLTLYNT